MANQLQTSFSYFLYPFRIFLNWKDLNSLLGQNQSIWQKSSIKIKEDYFFRNVQNYFNFNAELNTSSSQLDISQGIIYELKDSNLQTRADCSLEKLFNLKLELKLKEKNFPFKFKDGTKKNIFTPKLLIVPEAEIGLVSFSLELMKSELTIVDLIEFNYSCRALNKSVKNTAKIFPIYDKLNTQTKKVFFEIQNQNQNHINNNERDLGINFFQFISFLLADFDKKLIEPLSPKHFNIFSFAQTIKKIPEEDLNLGLFSLSRVYNNNYKPFFKSVSQNPEAIQLFENIYLAISQEGGSFIINSDKSINEFFNTYTESVMKTRYLWLYLLAYLQRVILINTSYKINYLLRNDNSIQLISKTIEWLSKIQIRVMFSEVSHITMHNAFYQLCRKNFKIPELFQELKEEIFDLNMIVQQKNEKLRRDNEIARKEKEKRDVERLKIQEDKQNRFERRINLILFSLGLMTFISVWKDFADLIENGFSKVEVKSLISLTIILLFMGLIIFLILKSINKAK